MGLYPLIICGSGNSRNNYIQRSLTVPPTGPFGGNLSISVFTLGSLYEQWQLLHNQWSRTNQDLDLVLYHHTRLRFWRNPKVDYIVTYSRSTPFKIGPYTHAAGQPFIMLMSKKKVVVPSLQTKPRGRPYKSLKIKSPYMLTKKFYYQSDFCNVGLFTLTASACRLQDPWISPDTISPLVTFYGLKNSVYTNLSIDGQKTPTEWTTLSTWTWIDEATYNSWAEQHVHTLESWNHDKDFNNLENWTNYVKKGQWKNDMAQAAKKEKDNYKKTYKFLYQKDTPFTSDPSEYLSHQYGIYSPWFLWPDPIFPEANTVFTEFRYNPHADKGLGNWVALQPLTKEKATIPEGCIAILRDYPLWCLLYGYADYCTKAFSGYAVLTGYRLIMRCTYTNPPLALPQGKDSNQGYVVYSHAFGTGHMPGGESQIPVERYTKWYPMFQNQLDVVEAIVNSGPLMPRDELQKGWDATLGYRASFTLGGVLPPKQDPVDPCGVKKRSYPDPDPKPGGVQVVDPATMDPMRGTYPWDYRRGELTTRALKRITEYHPTDAYLYPDAEIPPKKPRNDVSILGAEERREETLQGVLQSLLAEQEGETEDPAGRDQVQAPTELQLQLELQRQRLIQGKLQKGIQLMFEQLVKTQKGVHIDPRVQ